MPTRPVIEIEVQDEQFKRFYQLFENYKGDLESMPDSWKALDAAMGDATKNLSAGAVSSKEYLAIAAAQAGLIAEALRGAAKETDHLGKAADKTSRGMAKIRSGAEGIGKAIATVGGWIGRIAAIGGLGTLLGGFGIGELASVAFNRSKAAGGLGVSPGLLASFQVNAQQFLGVSALQSAVNTQIDITKAGYLAALGIPYSTAVGMNPSDLAFEQLKRARSAWLSAAPGTQMQQPAVMAYMALDGDVNDVRRAAVTPLSDLTAAQRATRGDVSALGIPRKEAAEWTMLKKKLDLAGVTIETVLIDRLAPLAPQIAVLAGDIADFIRTFVNSKDFGIIVDDVKIGLKDMGQFLHDVNWKQLGVDIEWVLDKLGLIVPKNKNAGNPIMNMILGPPGENVLDPKSWMNTPGMKWLRGIAGGIGGAVRYMEGSWVKNNPLDEKAVSGAWKQFATTAEGIRSNAALLAWYPKGFGVDTLSKIIRVWDPEGVGLNGTYARNVSKWSGVPTDLPMRKWSKAQFAAVIAAMSRQEGTDPVTTKEVVKALWGADLQRALNHPHVTPQRKTTLRHVKPKAPVHVSVTNSTAARVAISVNAVSAQ